MTDTALAERRLAVLAQRKAILALAEESPLGRVGTEVEQREWNTCVELRKIEVLREPGSPRIIACTETRAFMEVDENGMRALNAISAFPKLREAHAFLRYHHSIDLDLPEFVAELARAGFVKKLDRLVVVSPLLRKRAKTHLSRLQPTHVQWLHGKPFLLANLLVWTVALAFMGRNTSLWPKYGDIVVVDRASLVILAAFAFLLVNAAVHELAHLAMARSFGVTARVGISRRLHILVLQTDVTNAWMLPERAHRCLIFIAGMGYNLTFFSMCIIALGLADAGQISLGEQSQRILQFMAYMNILPLTFQMLVWLRTDFYYVLMTLTGHRALLQDSKSYSWLLARRCWLAALGNPRRKCPCGAAPFFGEASCISCGLAEDGGSRMPPPKKARWLLLGFAATSAFVFPLIVLSAVSGVARAIRLVGSQALSNLWLHWTQHSWIAMGEDLVALAAPALQATMVVWFLIPAAVKRLASLAEWIPKMMSGMNLLILSMEARLSAPSEESGSR